MNEQKQFNAGDKLVEVITLNVKAPRLSNVVVVSVGRSWVNYIDETNSKKRFDKDTMRIDGGAYSSPGKIYLSEQDFLNEVELKNKWFYLYQRLSNFPPKNLTIEKLNQIYDMLGVDYEPPNT